MITRQRSTAKQLSTLSGFGIDVERYLAESGKHPIP